MEWILVWQAGLALIFIIVLVFETTRKALFSGFDKLVRNLTSKRFIVMALATWFVYKEVAIDSNWLWLALIYIGIDTLQNQQVFAAISEFIKNRKQKG